MRACGHMGFSGMRSMELAPKDIFERGRYTGGHGLHHLCSGHLTCHRAVARNDKPIFRGMRKRKVGRRHTSVEADLVSDRKKLTRTSVLPSPESRGFRDSMGSGRLRPDHTAVVEIPSRHTKQIAISGHVGDDQIVSRHGAQSPLSISVTAKGFSSIASRRDDVAPALRPSQQVMHHLYAVTGHASMCRTKPQRLAVAHRNIVFRLEPNRRRADCHCAFDAPARSIRAAVHHVTQHHGQRQAL